MNFIGDIITGEFDQFNDEFVLQQVKQFSTSSILNKDQFNSIYEYLNSHKGEMDGQVLTLNEQMLVRLSKEEADLFINDLNEIRNFYH
ncbi:hypothetical protein [Halobacillus sp. Marseille-Q1614]|uniref:hypothetical protein n=1 Tax=Halobacillus sp. Marseille-Q1614 TaxID=2709134 RepID=UPI001570496B|nr:hypothetical protein [Halobacillus sp. Marseille-Q1614]